MRRVAIWFAGTVVVTVLLFLYRTSTSGPQASSVVAGSGPQAPGVGAGSGPQAPGVVSGSSAASPPAAPSPSRSATPSRGAAVTVNGAVAQTRWGPVQVQVKISGGRIVDVTAIVYPNGNGRDAEINSYALPRLRQQTLSAQSAHIDGVSGATVTSDGYRESLQAALDAAHFGS